MDEFGENIGQPIGEPIGENLDGSALAVTPPPVVGAQWIDTDPWIDTDLWID